MCAGVDLMEHSAQGTSGITIPAGGREAWRCGTERHGSVEMGQWLGLILELISNLYDSVILSGSGRCVRCVAVQQIALCYRYGMW